MSNILGWLYKWYRFYRLSAYKCRPTCRECGGGRLHHIGTDIIGNRHVWIEVYECDNCNKKYC